MIKIMLQMKITGKLDESIFVRHLYNFLVFEIKIKIHKAFCT